MPNAKAMAGSTPPGPMLPRPARPMAGHRGHLERLGPPAIRGAIPRPDRVGRRLRDPRHHDHGRDPRTGTPRLFRPERAAVSITTSLPEISVTSRHRVADGRARARDPPARARGRCARSSAWSPSAPPRRPRWRRPGPGRRHGRFRVRRGPAAPSRRRSRHLDREARIGRRATPAGDRRGGHARRGRGEAGVRLRQPPDRDGVRQAPRGGPQRPGPGRAARPPPASTPAQLKAAKEHSEAIKPVLDLAAARRLPSRAARRDRRRLRQAASSTRSRPPPTEEDLAKFDDPLDELFNRLSRMEAPLKLLEGLFIPKLMKGAREVWVHILVVGALLGIARPGRRRRGGDRRRPRRRGGLGRPAPHLAASRLSKDQLERLYLPLMHALADADNLADLLPRAGRCPAPRGAQGHRGAARRRPQEGRRQPRPGHLGRRGAARRAAPQDQRGLRHAGSPTSRRQQQRDLRDAIDAHDRLMADLKAQAEAKSLKLDEKYRTLKEQVRSRHEASWQAMAESWHEGIRHARPSRSTRSSARPPATARAGTIPPGPSRPLPRDLPPAIRFGEVTLDLARPARRHLGRPPADGRNPHAVHLPRAAAVPDPCQPADRGPARGPRRGAERPPGVDVPAADQPAAGPGPVHDRRPGRASAGASARSCTWPTSTGPGQPARSGPTPARSRSGWPTSPPTWRRSRRSTCGTSTRRSRSTTRWPARSPSPIACW